MKKIKSICNEKVTDPIFEELDEYKYYYMEQYRDKRNHTFKVQNKRLASVDFTTPENLN